jgi:hypothetical protein
MSQGGDDDYQSGGRGPHNQRAWGGQSGNNGSYQQIESLRRDFDVLRGDLTKQFNQFTSDQADRREKMIGKMADIERQLAVNNERMEAVNKRLDTFRTIGIGILVPILGGVLLGIIKLVYQSPVVN